MSTSTTQPQPSSPPRILAALVWIAIFVIGAASNVLVERFDALREGEAFTWWPPIIHQGTSITASLLLLPLLLAAIRRWPIHMDTLWPRLPLYLLGSVLWSLLHVLGMVALRKLAYAAMGGSYDYGPWAMNLPYEYGKDARDYLLIVTAVHSFDWYMRQRQGEVHALTEPDSGVPLVPEAHPQRPQRFVVRKLGREFLIATDDIEYLQANGNYVNLHMAGRAYPLRSTMAAIQAQLDPERFVRVHRGVIVNLGFLASIEPTDAGDARLHMKDGSVLPCSRRYRSALKAAHA